VGATTSQAKVGSMNHSEDNDNIDIEEENMIIRPMKPSHVNFGISKMKEGHIEVLNRFGYIDNVEWVWLGGDELVPNPKEDKVVVFQSFLKADLRFPLHKMIVAMLKRFNIYLHQLTPNAIVHL
jgi:predicted LPLAT superfamily acyltransferase